MESEIEIEGNGFGPNTLLVRVNRHTGTREIGRAADVVKFGSRNKRDEFGRYVMSGKAWESEHNWYRTPKERDHEVNLPSARGQERL